MVRARPGEIVKQTENRQIMTLAILVLTSHDKYLNL